MLASAACTELGHCKVARKQEQGARQGEQREVVGHEPTCEGWGVRAVRRRVCSSVVRTKLHQPLLEGVPVHGPAPTRGGDPEHDVAPAAVGAHVALVDVEAEEEDEAAEVAAQARLVGAAHGDHGGGPRAVPVHALDHLVARARDPEDPGTRCFPTQQHHQPGI